MQSVGKDRGFAGRDLRLLRGYVLYRNLDMADAQSILKALAEDEAYATARPGALYYYGRTLYGNGYFEEGANWLEKVARRFPEMIPADPIR